MRFAIVSDIHANQQAWATTLADIRAQQIERIICLGDIVGYGPNPAEVLSSIHANVTDCALGNHDAVLGGLLDPECFNDDAQAMIEWTRERLDAKAGKWLRTLPLLLRGPGFSCTHANSAAPEGFAYVYEEDDVRQSLEHANDDLIFVGHTHRAAIHYLNRDNEYRCLEPVDFFLEDGKRFIVNVGSVGIPRDRDFRSSYCVYDSEERSISFRRVAYDVEAFRESVQDADCPGTQAKALLALYDARSTAPVRELVDFRPGEQACEAEAEQEISGLHRRARGWRIAAVAMFAVLLAIAAVAGISWHHRQQEEATTLTPSSKWVISSKSMQTDAEIALLRKPSPMENGLPTGWQIHLDNPAAQKIQHLEDGSLQITSSAAEAEIELELPMIEAKNLRKFQILILGSCGNIEGELPLLFFDYEQENAPTRTNVDSKAAIMLDDARFRIQRTPRPLAQRVSDVRMRLLCRFSGTLTIDQCTLIPRELRNGD